MLSTGRPAADTGLAGAWRHHAALGLSAGPVLRWGSENDCSASLQLKPSRQANDAEIGLFVDLAAADPSFGDRNPLVPVENLPAD